MNKKVFSEESFSNNNPTFARNKTDFQVVQMAPDLRNKKERIDPLRKEQLYAIADQLNLSVAFSCSAYSKPIEKTEELNWFTIVGKDEIKMAYLI